MTILRSARISERITSPSGLGAGPAIASRNAWRHHSLNVCPRRAADFSHCAYSASLSLVPSDRPRNCFGEPFCWVASIKARAVLFQVQPRAGPSCFTGNRSAEGRRVVSCFPCSPTGGLNWDATTVSKIAQTTWQPTESTGSHYANRKPARWAQNIANCWQQRRSHMRTASSHTPTLAGVTCHPISRR